MTPGKCGVTRLKLLALALMLGGVHAATVRAQSSSRDTVATGTIAGTVIVPDGAAPLSGAIVTLVPLSVETSRSVGKRNGSDARREEGSIRTDGNGRYAFEGILPGKYQLAIARDGYISRSLEVELTATSFTLSAALERAAASGELAPITLQAAEPDTTTMVTGVITDAISGEPVVGVEVSIEGTQIRSVTEAAGRFTLLNVPPGPQTLVTRRIGYAAARIAISVPLEGTVEHDIRLAASALLMETVSVTADATSRARAELGTASVVDIEAIKHQTATSLSGALELVPGVELEPPGLDNVQQFPLRSVATSGSSLSSRQLAGGTSSTDLAAFGTAVIVNGVPQSNNNNLQTLGPRAELPITTAANGGIDLRRIPASTLQRVEVIRGIPSARWGDLTQGAVVVETRAGRVDPELKFQYDARTISASLIGGQPFGERHTGTAWFDVAGTRTSPGRSDDFSYRVAAQFMHRADAGSAGGLLEPKWRFDTRVDYYLLSDDRPENPNVGRTRASTSRDRGISITESARWRLSQHANLWFTGALTSVRQTSSASDSLVRGAQPITNRLTEGRQEGRFVIGPYRADVEIEGNPWAFFSRVEFDQQLGVLDFQNLLRGGMELRREWTTGSGIQFEVENPLQVQFNGVNGYDRPRSNDAVPPLATSAFYVDDRIQTRIGSTVLLVQAGMRLDVLHDGAHWFSGVRDALLQPRVNAEVAPAPWLRLRGGWGQTAKTPPLASLYPQAQYYDVVNVNYFANDPGERLAVLTTFIRDPTNPDLGFSRGTKAEAGIELGLGASAISLVAFRDQIDGGVGYNAVPTFLLREHFTLTDSVLDNGIRPEIVEPAERADTVPVLIMRPDNVINQTNRGLELTALFPEIPVIKTRFQVMGQWIETRQQSEALYYRNREDFGNFQLQQTDQRTSYWEGVTEAGKRVFLIYRVIHHQVPAGLLFTATIQHNITDEFTDIAATDTLSFEGYMTRSGELVPVPESERGSDEYHDLRLPRGGTLLEPASTPADWLLTVQVSKSLPLDGRLNFWAFNVLDKRGQVDVGVGVLPRIYPSVRVGLEVTMPLRALALWGN